MSRSSNIRVFVLFKELTVFAGDDVECTITFKNVESTKATLRREAAAQANNVRSRATNPLDHLKASRAPVRPTLPRSISALSQATAKAHELSPPIQRQDSALSVVDIDDAPKTPATPGGPSDMVAKHDRKHKRSVSIISLGSATAQQLPGIRHGRSGSAQYISPSGRRRGSSERTRSNGQTSPSPISGTSTPATIQESVPELAAPPTPGRRRSESRSEMSRVPELPQLHSRKSSPVLERPQKRAISIVTNALDPQLSAVAESAATNVPSSTPAPTLSEVPNGHPERMAPNNRVFSVQSNDETPRSSADFYSMSNRSDETLVSEYPMQPTNRMLNFSSFTRQSSQLGRTTPPEGFVETLMMGYVQVTGGFVLDGALVNQAPFEEVKRKAVVGGQAGGGVVGVTRPGGDSSMFGALSWGSIGESLGGLLGSGQPSSIREMKGIADSNSVPLISTPKSILFVDLRLAPGETKSYNYSFRMPRGLPPTHKGRAMKVSYNVIIGTQRPAFSKSQQQQIRQVEVPFRVFSGVNNHGESLGHDLMSPYIILKDQARIQSLDPGSSKSPPTEGSNTRSSSSADFSSYVNHLLTQPRKDSSYGLLSPTAELDTPTATPTGTDQTTYIPTHAPPTARMLIDHAIRASTLPHSAIYSPTNYTIARASIPIATLMLSRPAIKLGDFLTCVLDFSVAKLPCYALEATLESSEKVDPALAIRSPQSVERATRRVWGRSVESAVWARRVSFSFQVPVGATPGFGTTGVGLEWCVRVEIVVGKAQNSKGKGRRSHGGEHEEEEEEVEQSKDEDETFEKSDVAAQLLEMVHVDERGTTLAARERLPCESFEVAIPIRVFGAAVGQGEGGYEAGEEGLVV